MPYRRDKRGADADSARNDLELVEDVLDSIRLIQGVVSDASRTTLGDDPIRQAGVERYLSRIFETLLQLSPEIWRRNHDLSREDVSTLRQRFHHRYDEIDTEIVWVTVTKEIPKLEGPLVRIAQRLRSGLR